MKAKVCHQQVCTLAGQPPAEVRGKGRVEHPDIQAENDDTARNGRPRRDWLIHQGALQIATTSKHHQVIIGNERVI